MRERAGVFRLRVRYAARRCVDGSFTATARKLRSVLHGSASMTSLGYIVLFLAGVLGYAALLYRVLHRRAPLRDIATHAAMEHLSAAQAGRTRDAR
jgi:hypothetical protein